MNYAQDCDSNGNLVGERVNCAAEGLVCVPNQGCASCFPGRGTCDDAGNPLLCRPDGTGYDANGMCDPSSGRFCNPDNGICEHPCESAVASNSYIGCEYWPTPVMNGVDPEFQFAVAIANPQTASATVTVTRGGSNVATATVAPGALEIIRLPWVDAIKSPTEVSAAGDRSIPHSVLARAAAYRLVSSLPVTAYQFNPLEYQISRDCASESAAGAPPDGQCFSFTNDASLLLPTHVLTGNYMLMSRPTLQTQMDVVERDGRAIIDPSTGRAVSSTHVSPGFAAVVGVADGPVTVNVTAGAHIAASSDGSVQSQAPGSIVSYTLNQGDVLVLASDAPPSCSAAGTPDRIDADCGRGFGLPDPCVRRMTYCSVGADYDLTGTTIQATGPVQVIGGHECAFVPHNRWACDHLEESIFPLEAWGRDFTVAATQPLRSEPNVVRILAQRADTVVRFDPPVTPDATLAAGQVYEFETSQDFRVTGSDSILVGQFLVGQDYTGINTSMTEANGDPAFSLAIPTEQFRTDYTFLAPDSYAITYLNVTATVGQTVSLDGAQITDWRAVGSSGMQTARVAIRPGAHQVLSTQPFGIIVYGFGSYTSYMYPGGLDLRVINVI